MPQLRVLIVGASVAGPTAAYWLARAGAKVTVIERFPELRRGGQNIDIRTVGVTVMRRTPGMEEAVRAKRAPIDAMALVRDNGRPYGVLRPTGNPDQQTLISEYEILRGDLARILYDKTKDNENVNFVWNEQVTAIRQNEEEDGPVAVDFLNGRPSEEYDLVVACDGATSRTRAIGLGCGVRDHMRPLNAWVAYCSTTNDYLDGAGIAKGHGAVGGRTFAVGPGEGSNTLMFMGVHPPNEPETMTPIRDALKSGEDSVKQYVAKHFTGVGWKCQEGISDMLEAKDFYCSEWAQVKTPKLSRGRFALVGDAGYSPGSTGTGTSLAMLGGYVLAGEIAKHDGDLAAGLRGYEETMRPFIEKLSKIPSLIPAALAPQTSWGLWLRNHIFAFVCWSRIMDFASKYMGSFAENTDEFAVPEYKFPDE